jgi:hypothetical protein
MVDAGLGEVLGPGAEGVTVGHGEREMVQGLVGRPIA